MVHYPHQTLHDIPQRSNNMECYWSKTPPRTFGNLNEGKHLISNEWRLIIKSTNCQENFNMNIQGRESDTIILGHESVKCVQYRNWSRFFQTVRQILHISCEDYMKPINEALPPTLASSAALKIFTTSGNNGGKAEQICSSARKTQGSCFRWGWVTQARITALATTRLWTVSRWRESTDT